MEGGSAKAKAYREELWDGLGVNAAHVNHRFQKEVKQKVKAYIRNTGSKFRGTQYAEEPITKKRQWKPWTEHWLEDDWDGEIGAPKDLQASALEESILRSMEALLADSGGPATSFVEKFLDLADCYLGETMLAQVRTHYGTRILPPTFISHDSPFSPNTPENSTSTSSRTTSRLLPSQTAPALPTSLPLPPPSALSPPQPTQQVGLVSSGSNVPTCSPLPEPEATRPSGSLDGVNDANSVHTARPTRYDVYDIADVGDLGCKSGINSSSRRTPKRSHGEADSRPDTNVEPQNSITHTAEGELVDGSIVLTTLKDQRSKKRRDATTLRRSNRKKA